MIYKDGKKKSPDLKNWGFSMPEFVVMRLGVEPGTYWLRIQIIGKYGGTASRSRFDYEANRQNVPMRTIN